MSDAAHRPETVLDLWFPESGHWNDPDTYRAFWTERMQGGMDRVICEEHAALTLAAATGQLDHWAETPRGRLALLIALDQFPRSLWRDRPAAYAQDIKAARLAMDGIANGDFDGLAPWEKTFFIISISHCEGPGHLERMERLDPVVEAIIAELPPVLVAAGERLRGQHARVKGVIARFGRHPHRNAILGRPSTPDEEAYVAAGDFPHVPSKPEGASGEA